MQEKQNNKEVKVELLKKKMKIITEKEMNKRQTKAKSELNQTKERLYGSKE